MPPSYPFASARLTYRSIRAADTAIFNAINADTHGFINSNMANIHLPSDTDASDFMKHCAEKCLLGAVIWLPHAEGINNEEIKELKQKSTYGEAMVEEYGVAIGEIHLSRLAPDSVHHRFTEIGLDVLPEYQGKGYGGEAITWALDYAFRRAGLHRVRIRAFEYNAGAVRLYERLGFRHEGREREGIWHEGRWWDGIEMSMLEDEWREIQKEKDEEKARNEEV
ncbi:acetyltransferase [Ophiobolus disseminans]|uniref:Acetyltransferase n=1 Tax=Ophiobolus disseminans TaxID=1469910 RepID=A0A6A7AII7_9PLEO|nr:acetyltransferase [Ophiobolus disseminans]